MRTLQLFSNSADSIRYPGAVYQLSGQLYYVYSTTPNNFAKFIIFPFNKTTTTHNCLCVCVSACACAAVVQGPRVRPVHTSLTGTSTVRSALTTEPLTTPSRPSLSFLPFYSQQSPLYISLLFQSQLVLVHHITRTNIFYLC